MRVSVAVSVADGSEVSVGAEVSVGVDVSVAVLVVCMISNLT